MELEFYRCLHCGQIIEKIKDRKVPVVCCGEKMHLLEAGSVDAAVEKHVPCVEIKGNLVYVTVGSVIHPMTEPHFIEWIVLHTKKGVQRVNLTPSDEPKAIFALVDNDEVVAAYAYCNLHGLWKSK